MVVVAIFWPPEPALAELSAAALAAHARTWRRGSEAIEAVVASYGSVRRRWCC